MALGRLNVLVRIKTRASRPASNSPNRHPFVSPFATFCFIAAAFCVTPTLSAGTIYTSVVSIFHVNGSEERIDAKVYLPGRQIDFLFNGRPSFSTLPPKCALSVRLGANDFRLSAQVIPVWVVDPSTNVSTNLRTCPLVVDNLDDLRKRVNGKIVVLPYLSPCGVFAANPTTKPSDWLPLLIKLGAVAILFDGGSSLPLSILFQSSQFVTWPPSPHIIFAMSPTRDYLASLGDETICIETVAPPLSAFESFQMFGSIRCLGAYTVLLASVLGIPLLLWAVFELLTLSNKSQSSMLHSRLMILTQLGIIGFLVFTIIESFLVGFGGELFNVSFAPLVLAELAWFFLLSTYLLIASMFLRALSTLSVNSWITVRRTITILIVAEVLLCCLVVFSLVVRCVLPRGAVIHGALIACEVLPTTLFAVSISIILVREIPFASAALRSFWLRLVFMIVSVSALFAGIAAIEIAVAVNLAQLIELGAFSPLVAFQSSPANCVLMLLLRIFSFSICGIALWFLRFWNNSKRNSKSNNSSTTLNTVDLSLDETSEDS
jgi:hypothetical protein